MAVTYDKYWFNPVYYHVRKYSEDPNIRHIFVYGGKSSSKTYSISQLFLICILGTGFSAIMFRREATKLRDSLKRSISKILRILNISDAYEQYDLEFRCNQYPKQEAIIRLRGFEDEGAVKGIEDFKWILLDELDHFTEDQFNQADASLRGQPEQKVFATWNPISEEHWIKKWLDKKEWIDLPLELYPEGHKLHNVSRLSKHSSVRQSKDGMTIFIKTNFYDNKWVFGGEDGDNIYGERDDNLIRLYESYEKLDPDFYNINVLGNWGVIKADNPFIRHLDYNKQVGECKHLYRKNLPVYISLDFNEKWTALIKQVYGDKIYYFETLHDYPEEIMREIAMKYGSYEAYFTGDFSGNSKNQYTSDQSKKTAWKLARTLYNKECCEIYRRSEHQQFELYSNFDAVPTGGNVAHSASRNITNTLLYYWGNRVIFDKEGCRDLLSDCKKIEATNQGGLDKEDLNRKNIGHWLDVLRYDHAYFHYEDYLNLGVYQE